MDTSQDLMFKRLPVSKRKRHLVEHNPQAFFTQ